MLLETVNLIVPTFAHWWEFAGKFHPIVIHYPIVLLTILFFIDIAYLISREFKLFFQLRSVVLYVSFLTVIPSVVTGYLAAWLYPDNDVLVGHHQSLALITLILITGHAVAWYFSPQKWRLKYFLGFFILSVSSIALVSLTGEAGALIVRDTTPFQSRATSSKANPVLIDSFEVKKFDADKLENYLKSNISNSDVHKIFVDNQCSKCHAEQFSKVDFEGFSQGDKPWIILKNGAVEDYKSSLFYKTVILNNSMPLKNTVREEAGLTASERLILIEWLKNNLKILPPPEEIPDNEE